jgi:hypothetical protein
MRGSAGDGVTRRHWGGRTRQANRSAERWRGWRNLLQVRISTVVAALLVLAALYEGIEVIWVLSLLTPSNSRIRR